MKILSVFILFLSLSFSLFGADRDFYLLKIYHLKDATQEKIVDDYLQQAYIPALHRAKIKHIGVFKPVEEQPNEHLIYVFVPFATYADYSNMEKHLASDATYQQDGASYIQASFDAVPYERIETILLNAFEKGPHYNLPDLRSPKADRIYELRSYEGPTEKYYQSKLKMFNTGDEVNLFKRLNFNAVFYGEVIAGSRMPNLMYLTTFDNKASREQHWNAFNNDDYWRKLSALPEYQHNVSKADIIFLYPTEYSDI